MRMTGCPATSSELPPRARRIPTPWWPPYGTYGTTSACAENTDDGNDDGNDDENYLRVRGEYHPSPHQRVPLRELPPRARRIQLTVLRPVKIQGTTSACAENTYDGHTVGLANGNYLRVRGEYAALLASLSSPMELPPRARRILDFARLDRLVDGTTSACAENTHLGNDRAQGKRNYLRVRGEYSPCDKQNTVFLELPPRARRIPPALIHSSHLIGTTSACAENTAGLIHGLLTDRNYLRVRGEYSSCCAARSGDRELPPRARRIPQVSSGITTESGTTSACAENTPAPANAAPTCRNYLRVRGEYVH